MARLSSVLRDVVLGATVWPSSDTSPPLSADSMPRIVLARVDLPEPDSPTMPSVSPSAQLEIDVDERRHVDAALPERLRQVGQLQHLGVGLRRGEDGDRHLRRRFHQFGDAVRVMAPGETDTGSADWNHGRHLVAAQIVGQRAAIDEHTGRQVAADEWKDARDGGEGPLGLAHAVPGQRAQQAHRVGVLGVVEHLVAGAFLDDPPGVHHTDPVAQRADDAKVVGDQQHGRVALLAQHPNQIEHLRLDRGVEAGGRLVEHEELGVAGQRHGDDHALLHPTGELERIAVHHTGRIRDSHPPKRLERRLLGVGLRLAEQCVALDELAADLDRRVHRLRRVLVHHRCLGGPEALQLRGRSSR